MKTFATFFLLMVSGVIFAQTHVVEWFDLNWNQVDSKEKSSYYRITAQDAKTNRFIIEDRFASGELYRTGTFVSVKPEVRDGKFVWYFKNGRKHKEILYERNVVKEWTVWNEKKKVQLSVVLSFKGPNGEELFEAFKVDKSPEFKGGERAMKTFIEKNFVYPPVTKTEPVEGIVIVYVNVNADGKLSDPKIIRRVQPDVDNEAIRVIMSMPDWNPGTVDGKPVTIPYAIPVTIRNRSSLDYSRTRTSNRNI